MDSFRSKLTAPPAQRATQAASLSPATCCAQVPAPAHSLNQPLTLPEVKVGCNSCTMAGQEPYAATPQSCCIMPSLWPCHMIWHQLVCLALPCGGVQCCLQHRAGAWKTSLVTPIFKHGDATDAAKYRPISVVEQSAGCTPAPWYGALSHTQSSRHCGLPPRQATGQSLAPIILPAPFNVLLTGVLANYCTSVL